eukprot:TRINITY_DN5857_c0_g1_i1.p2 TRINITY_DN5857_c0_g1~~TRINITY_DN5857_c0_g1_i1.p2  ORF type:complete len:224 (+),score=47.85 TRINITY_DN5857_c0_g1_i1:46-672(+)
MSGRFPPPPPPPELGTLCQWFLYLQHQHGGAPYYPDPGPLPPGDIVPGAPWDSGVSPAATSGSEEAPESSGEEEEGGEEEDDDDADDDDEDDGGRERKRARSNGSGGRGTAVAISGDWLQLFADGERRRAEVARRVQEEEQRWAARPLERTDLDRRGRQTALYGSAGAARIQALEARLNAAFDRAKDTRRPVLWPQVPLRHVPDHDLP